jgi:imidazolonepropionase
MLRAIRDAAAQTDLTVIPTFLGAHAIDQANPHFVEQTINETLPAVATEFPGIACDAYCERGAWSLADTRRLMENAIDCGCAMRVHTDQFRSLGMTRLAIEMGAVTVDHLEAVTPADLEHLVRSRTIAVALPCSGFHLDDRYVPAREIVDAGGALALATNYNPGSAPTPSMPFTIFLACRSLRLTPAEAITCCTWNAACALQREDETGSIEIGKRADLQLLDTPDERELACEFAGAGPRMVVAGGTVVHRRGC